MPSLLPGATVIPGPYGDDGPCAILAGENRISGALSLVNILDVRRGDGTYVTSLAPDLLLEALSFIVDFHRDGTTWPASNSGWLGPVTLL